jgi:NAD(P)-dependent dehydrogenase (short-subunit alcohol dehydrogenase family)
MKTEVVVVIGAGGIGIAIARRQGFGKHILLADYNEKLLKTAAKELQIASYTVSTRKVDVSSRESVRALAEQAAALGSVMQMINTAGVSPNMAAPDRILAVDLYGSAVVFEEFERVIAAGGAGLIISSMAGHMSSALRADQEHDLAFAPADELMKSPSSAQMRFPTPWSRTSSPSAQIIFAFKQPVLVGASAAPASTPSARASLRHPSHSMS